METGNFVQEKNNCVQMKSMLVTGARGMYNYLVSDFLLVPKLFYVACMT